MNTAQPVQIHYARRVRIKWLRVIGTTLLIVGSLVMAFPLAYSIAASFCTPAAYIRSTWFPIPDSFYLGNYAQILRNTDMVFRLLQWFLNTILRIAWYIIVPGTVAVLAGYVFARVNFRGRNVVFLLLLASMTIPPIVYFVPTFIMLARWPLAGGNDLFGQGGHGFVNSWPAMLLPGLVNAYYIFLMRQTFYSIPAEYEDAARVDGASTWQLLRLVYLPMLKPAITVMVIFQSVAIWNDYLWPLIAVSGNSSLWPAALGAQQMIDQVTTIGHATNYPLALTIAMVVTFPTILLFLFLQRYFVEGVQGFGLKG